MFICIFDQVMTSLIKHAFQGKTPGKWMFVLIWNKYTSINISLSKPMKMMPCSYYVSEDEVNLHCCISLNSWLHSSKDCDHAELFGLNADAFPDQYKFLMAKFTVNSIVLMYFQYLVLSSTTFSTVIIIALHFITL